MKSTDIVPNATYRNADGDLRRVISDADTRSPRQHDRDTLQYVVVKGQGEGETFTMTRTAFSRWATARED